MNLQRLIEQYLSFQQSLGISTTTSATHSPGFRACPRRRGPPWPLFAGSRSRLFWAKPGP